MTNSLAIIGAGPSGLFVLKKLLDSGFSSSEIDIYEKSGQLGSGMPYSSHGAAHEHITNISANEVPELETSLMDWVQQLPVSVLKSYGIDSETFHPFQPLPRLLFGAYLEQQFKLAVERARRANNSVRIHYHTAVLDIAYDKDRHLTILTLADGEKREHETVVICSGHTWPVTQEGKTKGWYDSPYPPAKISLKANYDVAIRGSSLTAVDAIRTLARYNGTLYRNDKGVLRFEPFEDCGNFKITMYSRNGFLPAVRIHFENPQLGKPTALSREEIETNKRANNGFLELDYVFEKCFKEPVRKSDPHFYERIKDMNVEAFVNAMMELREELDAFALLKAEYKEAEKSIKRQQSIYWKEQLASLSFIMNYPAKYFSAEDTIRLRKILMPLIAVVIAFIPQSSAEVLIALHDAGCLRSVAVGNDAVFEPVPTGGVLCRYEAEGHNEVASHPLFIDCIGQRHLTYEDFPFAGLVAGGVVSRAKIRFRDRPDASTYSKEIIGQSEDNQLYLQVPGVAINDNFQVVDAYNAYNDRIYLMAVPLMGGFNPDYSGLDFCNTAADRIAAAIVAG